MQGPSLLPPGRDSPVGRPGSQPDGRLTLHPRPVPGLPPRSTALACRQAECRQAPSLPGLVTDQRICPSLSDSKQAGLRRRCTGRSARSRSQTPADVGRWSAGGRRGAAFDESTCSHQQLQKNLLLQAEFTPLFPRPPVRPNGYFKGFLPKANSWQQHSGPGDHAEDYYDKRENVNDKYRGRVGL